MNKKTYIAPQIEDIFYSEELCDMGAVFSNTADPEEFGAKGTLVFFDEEEDFSYLDDEEETWGNVWD